MINPLPFPKMHSIQKHSELRDFCKLKNFQHDFGAFLRNFPNVQLTDCAMHVIMLLFSYRALFIVIEAHPPARPDKAAHGSVSARRPPPQTGLH